MTRHTLTPVLVLAFVVFGQTANVHAAAGGTANVTLGTYDLRENEPNQKIEIYVSGSALISAMDFNLQIGDGGPLAGGTTLGPVFTGLDLVSNTIFQNDYEDPPQDLGSVPQVLTWKILTAHDGDYVSANGLLATVTIDTTGFWRGETFPLSIGNTLNGPTQFIYDGVTPVPTSLIDGQIVIVPEPSTLALLAVASVVLCGWAGRRAMRAA